MAFEKPQRYQSVHDLEPDATAEFAVDVRLDRLEKRLFRWLRVLTFAVLAALVVATWAIAYNFMGNAAANVSDAPAPVTTDLAVMQDKSVGYHMHDKRFGWFAAIKLGWTLFSTGVSLFGLYKGCKGYATGDEESATLCIVGAVATVITLGSMGKAGLGALGRKAGEVAAEGVELADIGAALPGRKKRSDLGDLDVEEIVGTLFNATEYNEYAKSVFPELDFALHGWMHKNHTRLGHLIPEGYDKWPVNSFSNHRGHRFHHVALPGFTDGHTRHRIGLAKPTRNSTSGVDKRDCDGHACFNEEYFTDGGLDFTACDGGDTEHLNSGDFDQMEPEIECYMTEDALKNNYGLEYQIYDSSEHFTLGAGSIAAFTADGDTYLQNMDYCPKRLHAGDCGQTQQSSG